jgi:hypothetical protein
MVDEATEDETLLAAAREKFAPPTYEVRLIRPDKRVGPIVLRNPTSGEFAMYNRSLSDESMKSTAVHNLFVTTCVHPGANVSAIVERYPGILRSASVQRCLAYLCGATAESEGKG